MKFVSYGLTGQERAAALASRVYVDLEKCLQKIGVANTPSSRVVFLGRDDWRGLLPTVQKELSDQDAVSPESVRLGAPIPKPGQVILAGVTYRSHRKEVTDDSTPKILRMRYGEIVGLMRLNFLCL